jgi:hypothetical protein
MIDPSRGATRSGLIAPFPVWTRTGETRHEKNSPNPGVEVMMSEAENLPTPDPEVEEALADELFGELSLFGRLIAIAALRGSDGTYRHKLSARFDEKEVDEVLKNLHEKVFSALLNLSLRQRMADLAVYFNADPMRDAHLAGLQGLGEQAIPASAKDVERNLFIHDLGIAQALLRSQL